MHLGYPYNLFLLNLLIILSAFYFLYKYAPFSTLTKYLITFSAPFLQLYVSYARSYSLTLLLLFILLSIYEKRSQKTLLYLTLIILLANTNIIGFCLAAPLGLLYLKETYALRKKNITPVLLTFTFGLLEILLIICQFYSYDTSIPSHTPIFSSLEENLNKVFFPLNIQLFIIIVLITIFTLCKNKRYQGLFFLIMANIGLLLLFFNIYSGNLHHHAFFYIILIAAYWIGCTEEEPNLNAKQLLPLSILAFLMIFNIYDYRKRQYYNNLRESAISINQKYPNQPVNIFILDPFTADIILPYLTPNITLLNQTATAVTTLKGLQEFLYYFYIPINSDTILKTAQKFPDTLLYKNCGKESYMNKRTIFKLKTHLTSEYCLYDIQEIK